MDDNGLDIFVHYDDLSKAGVSKDMLRSVKYGNVLRFSFSKMMYIGKYDKSKKAVEITYLQDESKV